VKPLPIIKENKMIDKEIKNKLIGAINYSIEETRESINGKHIHIVAGNRIIEAIEEIRLIVKELKESEDCVWQENEDGYWDTECKQSFMLEYDTPVKNGFKFCCYCGSKLIEKHYQPEVDLE
jgi:hypothetical protein